MKKTLFLAFSFIIWICTFSQNESSDVSLFVACGPKKVYSGDKRVNILLGISNNGKKMIKIPTFYFASYNGNTGNIGYELELISGDSTKRVSLVDPLSHVEPFGDTAVYFSLFPRQKFWFELDVNIGKLLYPGEYRIKFFWRESAAYILPYYAVSTGWHYFNTMNN